MVFGLFDREALQANDLHGSFYFLTTLAYNYSISVLETENLLLQLPALNSTRELQLIFEV